MTDMLTCEIVTPVKVVFSSEATYVGLPGEVGSFGVMRRHEPLVSALQAGVVNVTTPAAGRDGKVAFAVSGGYTEINDNKVIVLANDAIAVDDIDAVAVRTELEKVEKILAELNDGDSTVAYYKGQKAWNELQLKAVLGE